MKVRNRFLSTCFAAALLVSCGGDDDDSAGADAGVDCSQITAGQDDYTPGLEKIGDNGYTVQLMSATPAPPAKGDNVWLVHVLDDTQTARDGLDIDVNTWMPHHMHGSPIDAVVSPAGNPGEYTLDPVNLFMPGIWEVTIKLADGETALDEVTYAFCIDG